MRRAERRVAWFVLAAAAGAVALLGPASWTELLVSSAGVAAIGGGFWRAGWIGSRHRIAAVHWLADGRWLLADRHENTLPSELSADTRLAGEILWLRWKSLDAAGGSKRHSMLLTPGDLPAGQLRALRVRLAIQALERALPEARRR
jgi:hypothetical protein